MSRSKFTYPQCPYCKSIYNERLGSMKYDLMNLVIYGDMTNAKVRCDKCGQYFNVSVHIRYYGSKLS